MPRIALAWVQSRPGVASTIIGARTMEPSSRTTSAPSAVKLTPEHVGALDKATTPTLLVPGTRTCSRRVPAFAYGGTTINGHASKAWPQAPQNDGERF